MFKGKKTYILGAIAIITAVGTYLVGDMGLEEALQMVITAILGMTIRAGVTTEVKKVKDE